jgi:hypothetical protein
MPTVAAQRNIGIRKIGKKLAKRVIIRKAEAVCPEGKLN